MPNRTIGYFAYLSASTWNRVAQFFSDQRVFYELERIATPFNIDRSVEIRTPKQIRIDKECTIRARTILNGRSDSKRFGITLGENTYLKENCVFDSYGGFIETKGCCAFGQNTIIHGGGGVSIGKYVITGSNCYIISSNHNFRSNELPIMLQGDSRKGITIEDNVWLGGNVIVLDGITVGRNSVVAAGTVLTKDVPRNSLIFNRTNYQVKDIR